MLYVGKAKSVRKRMPQCDLLSASAPGSDATITCSPRRFGLASCGQTSETPRVPHRGILQPASGTLVARQLVTGGVRAETGAAAAADRRVLVFRYQRKRGSSSRFLGSDLFRTRLGARFGAQMRGDVGLRYCPPQPPLQDQSRSSGAVRTSPSDRPPVLLKNIRGPSPREFIVVDLAGMSDDKLLSCHC